MKKTGRKEQKELFFEILLFIFAIILTIKFWQNIFLLTLLLFGMWLIAIKWWHTKKDIVVFIVAGIAGPIGEILVINFGGAWYYSKPSFLGIPIWLPFLWGFAGMLLYRLANSFYDWYWR